MKGHTRNSFDTTPSKPCAGCRLSARPGVPPCVSRVGAAPQRRLLSLLCLPRVILLPPPSAPAQSLSPLRRASRRTALLSVFLCAFARRPAPQFFLRREVAVPFPRIAGSAA